MAVQDIAQLVQNAADDEDDDEEEEESPAKPSLARGGKKGGKAAAVCTLHAAIDCSVAAHQVCVSACYAYSSLVQLCAT